MGDFLLFTHTQWSEAPRNRHHVTRMLLDAGHRVFFFERPRPFWKPALPPLTTVEPRLTLVQTRNLFHHQLRALVPMHWLNALVVCQQIRKRLQECAPRSDAVVINFAHDYYFLRKLLPHSRIITIIHDDFEAQSRLPMTHHIAWSMKRTCQMSDAVFASSGPLQRRLSQWCKAQVLLPWSVVPYRAPHTQTDKRDTLLFWGFVDSALDLNVIRQLAEYIRQHRPAWKILLVGPTQGKGRQPIIDGVAGCPNVEIRERTNLDDLPLDRTLAALAPYRRSPACDSVTLANKSMQLFARGLPLLISGMPDFVKRPFIQRLDGPEGMAHAIDACVTNFNAWQPQIRAMVDENSPQTRLQLLGIETAAVDAAR